MNFFKLSAAAALVAASLSASAMSSIADEDLSAVAGQGGVSIAANLNINIGSFQWGNNADATGHGAAVSFDNIHISGLVAMTIDVISGTQFAGLYSAFTQAAGGGAGTTAALGNAVTAASADSTASFYKVTGGASSDVVQFAFPNIQIGDTNNLVNVSVKNITLGTNGANASSTANGSFGSFAINGLDLRGTTVWLWAH